MQTNTYLIFDGKCGEAFTAYERILGGKIAMMMPYKGSPGEEHVPADFADKIMHVTLEFDGNKLMGSDSPPAHYSGAMQGCAVSLEIEDLEEGRRVFDQLAEGGTVTMAFEPTFWVAGFGSLIDKYGVHWMVNAGPSNL